MEDHYKIIIIGAGITGLSTGLAWTKIYDIREHPALIIEKQPVPGGCISTFARKGYRFDTVQILSDVSHLLRYLDIDMDLMKFENYFTRLFLADPKNKSVKIFPISAEQEKFEEYLIAKFPDDSKNVIAFFEYCTRMYSELSHLKTEPTFWQLISILFHCPKIIANSGMTYKQFVEKFRFRNDEIYEILDTFSSFSGLSANRCAALFTACAMVTTLHGSCRPRRHFIDFPITLRKEFEKRGGVIRFNTKVEKILMENDRVAGVELADGTRIKADYVVSTADTQLTLGKMVGYEKLARIDAGYARKAQKAIMSPSAFAIHLGLDEGINLAKLGFDCGFNVLTTGRYSHAKLFDEWEKGNFVLDDNCFHMGVISPSVLTGGKPNLIIHVLPVYSKNWIDLREADYEQYTKEKNRVADFFVRKVEEYMIPGLSDHIKFMDVSTPATFARYIGSPTGSNYDMMPVPANFGKNRLKTRTPVKNLFLPKFSHGIWPGMQAGLQVVDMISGGKIMHGNSSYLG